MSAATATAAEATPSDANTNVYQQKILWLCVVGIARGLVIKHSGLSLLLFMKHMATLLVYVGHYLTLVPRSCFFHNNQIINP